MESNSKSKTYFAVIIFVVIILLSGYVVVDKIFDNNKSNKEEEKEIIPKAYIDSVDEISLNNDIAKQLYNCVDDERLEYYLFLDKNKSISWDSKSLIVMSKLTDNDFRNTSLDIVNIDREEFENKYTELFGGFLNNEVRSSSSCPTTAYNMSDDIYSIDLTCYSNVEDNLNYKTFLKNIVLDDNQDIIINKYYVFAYKDDFGDTKNYTLYYSNSISKDNMIVDNIGLDEINNYIYNMKTISYVFKKGDNGYYLFSIKG